ncbi:MAG: hypothetical protein H6581_28035 [Bacteroidia bacterium]|nr:hypothetical protein [Bacteroidia bacterium]
MPVSAIILALTYAPFLMAVPFVPLVMACMYAGLRFTRLSRIHQILSLFIFFTTAIQGVSLWLWLEVKNNMPLSHLNTAVGILLLAWFYQEVFRGFIDKWIFGWTGGLLFVFALINAIFLQGLYSFNSYALMVQCIMVIILSLTMYAMLLNDTVKEQKRDQLKSLNWINAGLFIYFASSILLFYFGKVIIDTFSQEISLYSWIMHSFFATIMYICFLIGLWTHPRN